MAKIANERGEGVFLLSYSVNNLEQAIEHLRLQDVRISDPMGGVAFVHPKSTNGINMQLMMRKES